MCFVSAWLEDEGPGDEETEGNAACVDEEPDYEVASQSWEYVRVLLL